MNWAIIIGIVIGIMLLGLIFLLREGFLILLGILALLGAFGVVMWLVYKWIFPPNWRDQ